MKRGAKRLANVNVTTGVRYYSGVTFFIHQYDFTINRLKIISFLYRGLLFIAVVQYINQALHPKPLMRQLGLSMKMETGLFDEVEHNPSFLLQLYEAYPTTMLQPGKEMTPTNP